MEVNYSQNNEQQIITDYFGSFVGTFLDIGANDGKTFSNSAKLVDLGWDGVMVEPSPSAFKALEKNYFYNKRVQPINCAVSDKSGAIKFYECNDTLLSSLNEDAVKLWNMPYTCINIQTLTYKLLLEEVKIKDFDFINIDAERYDWEILQQIDLTNVKSICIEHSGGRFDIMFQYCTNFGMKLLFSNGENIIMGR